MAAHQILSKLLDEFTTQNPSATSATGPVSFPALTSYITKYQDPQNVGSILKIQKELDETKVVLHKTIESVSGHLYPSVEVLLEPDKVLTVAVLGRFCNVVRNSTTLCRRARVSARRARCFTLARRSKTPAALSCESRQRPHSVPLVHLAALVAIRPLQLSRSFFFWRFPLLAFYFLSLTLSGLCLMNHPSRAMTR
jgi:hypothetical protein